jgi:hypothetical protein
LSKLLVKSRCEELPDHAVRTVPEHGKDLKKLIPGYHLHLVHCTMLKPSAAGSQRIIKAEGARFELIRKLYNVLDTQKGRKQKEINL